MEIDRSVGAIPWRSVLAHPAALPYPGTGGCGSFLILRWAARDRRRRPRAAAVRLIAKPPALPVMAQPLDGTGEAVLQTRTPAWER